MMMINDHELRDFTFQFILIVLFIWLKILSLELPFFVLWSSAVCESWTFIFWLLMGQFFECVILQKCLLSNYVLVMMEKVVMVMMMMVAITYVTSKTHTYHMSIRCASPQPSGGFYYFKMNWTLVLRKHIK